MHDTRKWSVTSSLWGMISISVWSIPCDIIKSSVWLKRCVGPVTFCLTPKEFIRSVNASPNASFVLSTWMLKSPTISALSTVTNRSERKSANSLRKSVYVKMCMWNDTIHAIKFLCDDLTYCNAASGLYSARICDWKLLRASQKCLGAPVQLTRSAYLCLRWGSFSGF